MELRQASELELRQYKCRETGERTFHRIIRERGITKIVNAGRFHEPHKDAKDHKRVRYTHNQKLKTEQEKKAGTSYQPPRAQLSGTDDSNPSATPAKKLTQRNDTAQPKVHYREC